MTLDLFACTVLCAVELDLSPDRTRQLADTLSPDELDRAARFHFTRDRDRYVAGRGQVRTILGALLDRAPASLRFHYGPQGKPGLPDDGDSLELRFNFSHSLGRGLLAVQVRDDIGVDIECLRPVPEALTTARKFFSPEECRALEALPAADRESGFLRCWTRKEAVLKSFGRGLSHRLDSFTVSCGANAEPERVVVGTVDLPVARWVQSLSLPAPGYVVALATAGSLRHPSWVVPAPDGTLTPVARPPSSSRASDAG